MNLGPAQLQWVTRTIHFFMMLQSCKSCSFINGLGLFKHLIAILGMLPNLLLLRRSQCRWFMENLRVNLAVADIME
ncbi:hypothetical protein D3C76_1796400 [compost metagenome]